MSILVAKPAKKASEISRIFRATMKIDKIILFRILRLHIKFRSCLSHENFNLSHSIRLQKLWKDYSTYCVFIHIPRLRLNISYSIQFNILDSLFCSILKMAIKTCQNMMIPIHLIRYLICKNNNYDHESILKKYS